MRRDSFAPLTSCNDENIVEVCLSKKGLTSTKNSLEKLQFNIECTSMQDNTIIAPSNIERQSLQIMTKENDQILILSGKLSRTKEDCSSIITRSIKKMDKDSLVLTNTAKKLKFLMQLKQKKDLAMRRVPLGRACDLSPEKFSTHLFSYGEGKERSLTSINQDLKFIEQVETNSKKIKVGIEKSIPRKKSICCLNNVPIDTEKMQVLGINVFFDSDEDSFSFLKDRKTTRFIVQ